MYQSYSPNNYKESKEMLVQLTGHDHNLKKNFDESVWVAITVNLGPQTVTFKH